MQLYGLVGYPLEHSFSKNFFQDKFKTLSLAKHQYQNFPIVNISEIRSLVNKHPNLKGINITNPHKQTVIPYLDYIDPIAEDVNAVNVIKIQNGILTGYNTDIIGFEKSISSLLEEHHKKALILGSGGAAHAVRYSLNKLSIPNTIVSRSKKNFCLQYSNIDKEVLEKHQLIINASPAGMFPVIDEYPNIPFQHINQNHFFFDLIYNPEETLFLQKAASCGAKTKNGYEMLTIQAEAAWDIWNS